MDLKSTIDIILKDLKEARDIMDDLKNYPEVPEIQIELAKAKCHSAEQVLKFITEKDLSTYKEATSTPEGKEIFLEEEVKEESIEAEIEKKDNIEIFEISDLEEDDHKSKDPEKEEITSSEDTTIIDQIVQVDSAPEATEKGKEKDKKQKGQILADKFTSSSSINEKIANKRHDTESAEVSKIKPISNLSDAIGINDRFQFVRELFNGNQELYSSTIKSLNDADSVDEAFNILSKATQPDSDSEIFDLLLELVKRKLTKK